MHVFGFVAFSKFPLWRLFSKVYLYTVNITEGFGRPANIKGTRDLRLNMLCNLVPRAMPVRGLGWHWLWGNRMRFAI